VLCYSFLVEARLLLLDKDDRPYSFQPIFFKLFFFAVLSKLLFFVTGKQIGKATLRISSIAGLPAAKSRALAVPRCPIRLSMPTL